MIENLPFGALRAFEAAARHLSFKRAAAELHVTPAAISQQIKTLEHLLGVTLFERKNRGLSLTPEAEIGLQQLKSGFEQIEGAVRLTAVQVHGHADDGEVGGDERHRDEAPPGQIQESERH